MPKTPIDYSKSIIYKLCCKDPNITDIYIGSTTHFTTRRSRHKHNCNTEYKTEYNFYVYQFIRANGGWDNWDMIMIEKLCCNNKNECLQKERYYIELLKATLNKKIPVTTIEEKKKQQQEWAKKNNEKIKQYKQEWKKKHKLNKIE